MKLTQINESMLDNAGKWLRAKIQSWNGPKDERLRTLVSQATKIDGSILRDSEYSRAWWEALLKHYSIPTDRHKECVFHVTNVVHRKLSNLLSDDPEPYIDRPSGRGHKKHPRVNWHELLAHIVDDHKRMHESTWSGNHKMKAISKLAAVLAIDEVAKFSRELRNNPQKDRNITPEEKEAQDLVERLWVYSNIYATGREKKINKPLIQAMIDRLKELGFNIRWQGKKTAEYPQGDQKPLAVRRRP